MPLELRQSIFDFEPRRFVCDEDVSLGAKAGILVQAAGGHEYAISVSRGHIASADRTEDPRVAARLLSHRRFVFLHQRFASEPSKIGRLADEFSHERRAAGFSASRAMI